MQDNTSDGDLHANEKARGVVLPCLYGERVGDAGGGGCHTDSTLEVLCFVSQSGVWGNLQEDAERRETRLDSMWDVKKLPPPHAVAWAAMQARLGSTMPSCVMAPAATSRWSAAHAVDTTTLP